MKYRLFFSTALLWLGYSHASAQRLKLTVVDTVSNEPVPNVIVTDLTNHLIYSTDNNGTTVLDAKGKDTLLLDFNAFNYAYKRIKTATGTNITVALLPQGTGIMPVYVTSGIDRFTGYSLYVSDSLFDAKNGNLIIEPDDIFASSSAVSVIRPQGIYSNAPVVTVGGIAGTPSRTVVLFDGMRLNKGDDGNVNWNMFSPSIISSAFVGLSAQSTVWGAGAMGGVVALTRKEPEEGLHGQSELFFGRYATNGVSAGLSDKHSGTKGFFWDIDLFAQQSAGYISTPESLWYPGVEYIPTSLKETKFNVLAGYDFSDSAKVKFYLNLFSDYRGLGKKINEENYTKHPAIFTAVKYSKKSKKMHYEASLHFSRENYFKNIESIKKDNYSLIYVISDRQDAGMELAMSGFLNPRLLVSSGATVTFASVRGQDTYQTSSDVVINSGAMASGDLFSKVKYFAGRAGKWFVQAAAEASYNYVISPAFVIENPTAATDFMLDYTGLMPDNRFHAYSYSASIGYMPGQLRLIARYGTGYTLPTLEDLTRSGFNRLGFKIANPLLKPEKINDLSASLEYPGQKITLSTELHHKKGYDFMYYVQTGDYLFGGSKPVIQKRNVTSVTIDMANVLVSYDTKKFGAYANYTYTYSRINNYETQPELNGKMLTYTPEHTITTGLYIKHGFVAFASSLDYVSQMYEDNANTMIVPAHYSLNSKLTLLFNRHLSLTASIDNITDTRYVIYYDQLSLGRFWMFSLKYRF